jgi:hypothetical protein
MSFWLPALLFAVPEILVLTVGIGISLMTWHRHPRVSLAALSACLLLLIDAVGGPLVHIWLVQRYLDGGGNGLDLGMLGMVRTVLQAFGYFLLLLAVFGWRARPVPPWQYSRRLDEERIDADLAGARDRHSEDIQKGPRSEDR